MAAMARASSPAKYVGDRPQTTYIPSLKRTTNELSESRKCRTTLRIIRRILYLYGSWSL
jgi:hypothetical protein